MVFPNLMYNWRQVKSKVNGTCYTKIFAETLIKHAEQDTKIIGITGAMPSGTGMDIFGKEFPERMFDVGIAEQHAVTFAAGLSNRRLQTFCSNLFYIFTKSL